MENYIHLPLAAWSKDDLGWSGNNNFGNNTTVSFRSVEECFAEILACGDPLWFIIVGECKDIPKEYSAIYISDESVKEHALMCCKSYGIENPLIRIGFPDFESIGNIAAARAKVESEIAATKERIIDYATKVVHYPKGSKGYDPVDMANLEMQVKKLERLQIK